MQIGLHFRQNLAQNNKKLLQIPSNPHNIKLFSRKIS
jgi:hypothetical protein